MVDHTPHPALGRSGRRFDLGLDGPAEVAAQAIQKAHGAPVLKLGQSSLGADRFPNAKRPAEYVQPGVRISQGFQTVRA